MQIVKQHRSLPIMNMDEYLQEATMSKKSLPHHSHLLPDSLRGIICGSSGSGKTNVMLSLLFDHDGLKFENVYLYSKSLYQPKYELLKTILDKAKEVGYYAYKDNDDIIDPADIKPNSVCIFDDISLDKQDKIRAFFSMGRHKNADCFYLCQSYARIPKHLIRDNASCLIIFKQDELNLRHIYDDHVTTDMSLQTFRNMCEKCWEDKYGFLVIMKEMDLKEGRYRKGFDNYIYL